MSSTRSDLSWGPSHEYIPPPGEDRGWLKVGAKTLIVLLLAALLPALIRDLLLLAGLAFLAHALLSRFTRHERTPAPISERLPSTLRPADGVREHMRRLGGGAFLGFTPGGGWVTADPEHAVMVLGPPRSGKTSSVVIPSLLAAPGAALSTSTKPDVMHATWRSRAELGQVWLFDPAGESTDLPGGVLGCAGRRSSPPTPGTARC